MSHLSLPRIHFQGGRVTTVDTASLEALRLQALQVAY